jgi:hypothetical protein
MRVAVIHSARREESMDYASGYAALIVANSEKVVIFAVVAKNRS